MNPEEKKVKKDLLAEKLLQGVEEVFTSQKFKDYLKFYSSFYHYSIRNTILIFLQKPDAQLVAGYESWKKKGRQVRYGEKGIQIFCPVNYYVKLEVIKRDKNGNPVLDENGDPVKEIRKEQAKTFRVGYVYDISQTDGKDPPELASELHGEARNYESIMAGIRHAAAPFSVSFEDVPFAKGYCDFAQQKIVIKQGMSEMQSVKTALHELAHSKLHESREESRETREIEAESVAYMIADHFGLDTSDYSFPYIASWGHSLKPEELLEIISGISNAAKTILYSLEEYQALEDPSHAAPQKIISEQEQLDKLDSISPVFDQENRNQIQEEMNR